MLNLQGFVGYFENFEEGSLMKFFKKNRQSLISHNIF